MRLYCVHWPVDALDILTRALRDPSDHPRWLPEVIEVVGVASDLPMLMLEPNAEDSVEDRCPLVRSLSPHSIPLSHSVRSESSVLCPCAVVERVLRLNPPCQMLLDAGLRGDGPIASFLPLPGHLRLAVESGAPPIWHAPQHPLSGAMGCGAVDVWLWYGGSVGAVVR